MNMVLSVTGVSATNMNRILVVCGHPRLHQTAGFMRHYMELCTVK